MDFEFAIQGFVIGGSTAPIQGASVVAVEDPGRPKVVLQAVTTAGGQFVLVATPEQLKELFRVNLEDQRNFARYRRTLWFRAFVGRVPVAVGTADVSLADFAARATVISLTAAEDSAPPHCAYYVRGRLLEPDGTPVVSTTIEVVHKLLRSEAVLATGTTNAEGKFAVRFVQTSDCDPEGPRHPLFVRAVDATPKTIASSQVFCDPPAELDVVLVVGDVPLRGRARVDALAGKLTPHLDGVGLHELTVEDVVHLACATHEPSRDVALLARAERLRAAVADIDEDFDVPRLRDAFFAFGKLRFPLELIGILAKDDDALQAALVQAASDNIVAPWDLGQIQTIVNALAELRLELSVPSSEPQQRLLGQLLLTGGVAPSLPRQFLESYLAHTGPIEEFWADFRTTHGNPTTDTVQFTLTVGALTGNHIPLVEVLQTLRSTSAITHARDLARRTAEDWEEILHPSSGPAPEAPASFPGQTAAARRDLYAKTLVRVFETAFPTSAVAGGLARAELVPRVVDFVDLNPSFDFRRHDVDTFLNDSPVLPGGDISTLPRDLKHVQRLHAIAPRFGKAETVARLVQDGFVSAGQVARQGFARLREQYGATFGDAAVKEIYELAERRRGQTAQLEGLLLGQAEIPVVLLRFNVPATLEGLFGSQDYCECHQCRSVLGPAAYLADLLMFLRDRGLLSRFNAFRPDIQHILLNCQNANTVLPTIDLVNEVLERLVEPSGATEWPQTTWTEAELQAHPEYLHVDAYETLRVAVYPWILPFDLWLEEARGYLDHLGVRLVDLLIAFHGHEDEAARHALAVEQLRLSSVQADLIEAATAPTNATPWGLDVSWSTAVTTLGGNAREFATRAGLDYEGLLDLFHTGYVAMPSGGITIDHEEAPCSLDGATLDGLDPTKLRRAHRFIRLARTIGWSFAELDAALRALGTNVTDPLVPETTGAEPSLLGRLAGVVRLLARFRGLTRLEVLAWFGLLDTRRGREGEPSYYDTVFLDRTVALDPGLFDIEDGATQFPDTPAIDDALRSRIVAALELSDESLGLLLDPGPHGVPMTTRTLLSLSALHRRASLARALGITIRDLLLLALLTGEEPFLDGPSPSPDVAHTEAFIATFDRVRSTPFSLADLDYVLRHRFEPGYASAIDRSRIAAVFLDLIRGLQSIEIETSRAVDASATDGDLLRDRLPEVVVAELAGLAFGVVVREGDALDGPTETAVRAQLASFLDEEAIDLLFDLPAEDTRTPDQRATATLDALVAHLRTTRMTALVIQRLSAGAGVESGLGELLLHAFEVGETPALDLFLADAFVHAVDFEADAEAIKALGFPIQDPADALDDHFIAFERLYKAAIVLQRFRLPRAQAEWLLVHAETLALLNPLSLPVEPTAETTAFAAWDKLARLVRLRDTLFREPTALFDLLASAIPATALSSGDLDALAQATGWDRVDLGTLVAPAELDVDGSAVQALDGLERLERTFTLLRRLGVTAERASGWATATVTPAIAQSIKESTRSKYPRERWPDIISPLRNRLREQQRDALAAYVVADLAEQFPNDRFRTSDDLLGTVLIDVLGQSCQTTSRIAQATLSVQLFVQRVLMNLVPLAQLSDESAGVWQWMNRYPYWHANRLLFLYPENYALPELRDDQSPFFRELSETLLEGELTDARVSDAYVGYLTRLDEVARLSVSGLYHQVERDPIDDQISVDILHVFARTIAKPYRFFYRRRTNGLFWTPWEPVPLGIESDDVMPLVLHGRLLLLWTLIQDDAEEPTSGSDDAGNIKRPSRFLRVRLNLSEYIDGTWTQPVTSDEKDSLSSILNKFIIVSGATELIAEGDENDRVFIRAARRLHFHTEHQPSGKVNIRMHAMSASIDDSNDDAVVFGMDELVLDHRLMTRVPQEVKEYAYYAGSSAPAWFNYQSFQGQAGNHLTVPVRNPLTGQIQASERLFDTPSTFELVAIRHNKTPGVPVAFASEEPFFYQDEERVFFIVPSDAYGTPSGFDGGDTLGFGEIQQHDVGSFADVELDVPQGTEDEATDFTILNAYLTPGSDNKLAPSTWSGKRYRVYSFEHPHVPKMIAMLQRSGVLGLLDPPEVGFGSELRRQALLASTDLTYDRGPALLSMLPTLRFDFSTEGAYSSYNWELFFHAPLLVATRLMAANRFAEARKWLHVIFDPTDASNLPTPQRFWKLRPFYLGTDPENIVEQLESLSYDGNDPEQIALREITLLQIEVWRRNPFNPHVLARLRPRAYQIATVMTYLDNLIAWGDQLFRQHTRESINEATQLYVLAAEILGPRPEQVRGQTPPDRSFAELADDLDAFANALVELENVILPGNVGQNGPQPDLPQQAAVLSPESDVPVYWFPLSQGEPPEDFIASPSTHDLSNGAFETIDGVVRYYDTTAQALYFCIPPNPRLLGYWDTVADRLFKIRNCLDIEGVRRSLPLFEPPIDPALLVRAAAAGIDLSSALASLGAPLPHYRFRTTLAVAQTFANEVRTLGSALLSALERKDAETLAELRTSHELRLAQAVRAIREEQVAEARQAIETLIAAKQVILERLRFFDERVRRIASELQQQSELSSAQQDLDQAKMRELAGNLLGLLPNFQIGAQGWASSPVLTATFGGVTYSTVLGALARWHGADASIKQGRSTLAGIEAGLTRRDEDWDHEVAAANLELARLEQDILAAQIRFAVTEKELQTQELQISQARQVDELMRSRFTNAELYGWMTTEIGRTYYQAYQLAFDLAKRAERSYQHELAAENTSFISFGYWDNQRQGLLAGDKLLHDLRRMEAAHLQNHRREFELTKRVSLAQVDPMALVLLRENGECWLEVPEVLFDLTHPGHYLRRLKSVAVTVATVGDPVAEIPVTLTLDRGAVRRSPSIEPEALVPDPSSTVQQIATSTGEDDPGLFERNFNDERYLPFEGRGAVSTWHIELPRQYRPFDYGTIKDVVLQIAYTARQGGEGFRGAVEGQIQARLAAFVRAQSFGGNGLLHLFSARREYPDAWNRFLEPGDEENRVLTLDIAATRFPWRFQPGELRVDRAWVFTMFRDAAAAQAAGDTQPGTLPFELVAPTSIDGSTSTDPSIAVIAPPAPVAPPYVPRIGVGQVPNAGEFSNPRPTTGTWTLTLPLTELEDASSLEDVAILLQYRVIP